MFKSTFVLILVFCLNVFPMGDDKLGPHGGYIRMPGTFHTELVLRNNNLLNVYLLDMGMKNPETLNSSIEMELIGDKSQEKASCKVPPVVSYFECKILKNISNFNEIKIKVVRGKIRASKDAVYKLPLKLK